MIESLLKYMGFFTEPVVNYDPHHVISNRRKALKRNPFDHEEIVGLADVANWYDYPEDTPKYTDMKEDSNSSVREISSLIPDISKLISATENIVPLENHLERTNKRDFLDAMDTEEEDTAITPKKHNTEAKGKIR